MNLTNKTDSTKTILLQYAKDGQDTEVLVKAPTLVKTLKALFKAKRKGITALELSNTWALRLGAYVFQLRHDYGLHIITQREMHDGGWHARYVLITPVTII